MPPRLAALVADHGRERGGEIDVGHAIGHRERLDPGVVGLGHRDGDSLHVERQPASGACASGEERLRIRRPRGNLLVADEHDPLVGEVGHPLGGLRREIDRLRDGAGPVDHADRVDRRDGVFLRAERVEAVAAGRPAERDDGRPAAGGKPLEGVLGAVLRIVEEGAAAEPLAAHAQAVVDDEDRVERAAAGGRGRAEPQERPRHREAEENHGGRPQHEQQEVAKPQERAAPPHRLQQEIHRPPVDLAKPRPVEEMDDDRRGGRGHAGDGERQGPGRKRDHGRGPPVFSAVLPGSVLPGSVLPF